MSNETDDKTKQEYIGNFIRALAQVEAEMLPYQEHRKRPAKELCSKWMAYKARTVCRNPRLIVC